MKTKTNAQIIKDLTRSQRYGVLAEAFVMEAIARYADEIAGLSPQDFPSRSVVDPSTWIGIAKEVQEKLGS